MALLIVPVGVLNGNKHMNALGNPQKYVCVWERRKCVISICMQTNKLIYMETLHHRDCYSSDISLSIVSVTQLSYWIRRIQILFLICYKKLSWLHVILVLPPGPQGRINMLLCPQNVFFTGSLPSWHLQWNATNSYVMIFIEEKGIYIYTLGHHWTDMMT